MHTLLKRQLRKHLPNGLASHPEMESFLSAVERSYENYDDKLEMLHRATTLSSEELYEANAQLKQEAAQQKNILFSLEKAVGSLTKNLNGETPYGQVSKNTFNMEHLAKYISNLATEVLKISHDKDRLLKDLEIKNQSLNNYAQMVSHDLRSPIRNINALVSWILEDEKGKFSEVSEKNCSLVLQNLEKMDKLITGILNHATLGKTDEQRVHFNLREICDEIEKTIFVPENVEIKYVNELPDMFFEKGRLEQLLMNLITNAVTATEHLKKGIITVAYEEDAAFWKFSVSDNGKGIAQHHQEGIFKMFKKLENDETATGIGLAIVKKIIDMYDGQIKLESQENKGTEFSFALKKA